MKQGTILRISAVIALLFVLMIQPSLSQAYTTAAQWPYDSGAGATYTIDPSLSSALGVTNANSAIQAAGSTWDTAGIFRFMNQGYWLPTGNIMTYRNFTTNMPCGYTGSQTAALTCWETDPARGNVMTIVRAYYNIDGTYHWNTSNMVSFTDRDVQTTTTHEFGHWLAAGESTIPNCTMNASRRTLCEDDKQVINQLYGPYTGFDGGRADGIQNLSTFNANVTSYSLGPVVSENGVTPWFGTRMLRITGNATTSMSSYIYFKLFSIDRDTASNPIGAKIHSNSHLKWCQYDYLQTSVSVDAYFSDGTALRNYSTVVDQYGVRIHPAYRGGGTLLAAAPSWTCYDFNMAPVVGKVVLHWYVAYDNRGPNGTIGTFRSYIDSLKFVWPQSRQ